MSWLRIDDGFPEHEKVLELSDRAFRVHVVALAQCAKNLTDGQIDSRRLTIIKAIIDKPVTGSVRELVAAGLWVEDAEGGYSIRDYLDYNPSAEKVKEGRKRASDRQRGWRERNGVTNAVTNGERDALRNAAPSQPRPSPKETSKAVPANQDIRTEIEKILRLVKGADDGTEGVLLSLARRLPLSSVARVRESCQGQSVGAGYAVEALKSELKERNEGIA